MTVNISIFMNQKPVRLLQARSFILLGKRRSGRLKRSRHSKGKRQFFKMTTDKTEFEASKIHNAVADVACSHYHRVLPKNGKPVNSEWTTLAAIVQSTETKFGLDYKVISMCTGTKCLGRKELSPNGDKLSDSHAEVLARRGLLLYLYDQIISSVKDKHAFPIFTTESCGSSEKSAMSFVLLPGISFHMFITQLPCGDACIYSNDGTQESESVEALQAKKPRMEEKLDPRVEGMSRTGAKVEVGGSYEEHQVEGKCRLKPGKGDPTLSMSCSDKIAKWQMLGLQGAVLGILIPKPVRLASITIGSGVPFNEGSLRRAVFSRVKENHLKNKESYNCPILGQSENNVFKPSPLSNEMKVRPAPGSIIWTLCQHPGLKNVEVSVNGYKLGVTKRAMGTPAAQLSICRRKLVSKFLSVTQLVQLALGKDKPTYAEIKALNTDYKERWKRVKSEDLLGWTEKPIQLSEFCVVN